MSEQKIAYKNTQKIYSARKTSIKLIVQLVGYNIDDKNYWSHRPF